MIKVKLFGGRKIKTRFTDLSAGISNMRPAHLQAATTLFRWIQRNFKAEGHLHEDKTLHWLPLSPLTKEMRRGIEPYKILQDTGRLKQGWDIYATPKSGFVKSRVEYSDTHEYGGTTTFE